MPCRIEYHQDQEIVEVAYSGDTSAADLRDTTIKAITLIRQENVTRALIDCLEQTKTGSILDLLELPSIYDREGVSRAIRIAFVEPAKKELQSLALFYDKVCAHSGWDLHRFETRDDALAWLLSA